MNERHSGLEQAHRVLVLEEGMKFNKLMIPPDDAQWLETRKFQVNEVARIYRIPPHKLGDLERATFSNIEEQSIEFVTDTLTPWLVRWEQAIARDLLDADDRRQFFAEFKLEGLLRGKTSERFAAYSTARQWGWMSANDVLALENRNPIGPAGDIYLSPMNMLSAEQALRMVQERPDMELEQEEGTDREGRPARRLTVRRRQEALVPAGAASGNGGGT
jgi:phage portal protein BeeE